MAKIRFWPGDMEKILERLGTLEVSSSSVTDSSFGRGMGLAGLFIEGQVKGRSRVLTGRLRSSYATVQESDVRVIVGTNVEYAPFVGGSGMSTGHVGAGERFIQQVINANTSRVLEIIRHEVEIGLED